MVDGCRSKLINVVSGVLQGSDLGPLLFLWYTLGIFSILKNELIGDSDDSAFLSVVPSPGVRAMAAGSQNRDHGKVSEWCDFREMKFNDSKTKNIIASKSRTMHILLYRKVG